MTSPTSQLLHAIAAQARGWHIFPCEPGEKTGALLEPGKPWKIKWYESATNDIDMIMRLWGDINPLYNIGISCKKSGLLVVDCDVPKDLETATEDGWDQFRTLCESHGVGWEQTIDTYQVETPSKGVHLYYRWPDGVLASQASLDTLLDVRTNGGEKGGYVVGAGSCTPGGWYHGINPAPVKDAPEWLVEKVRLKETFRGGGEPFTRAHGVSLAGLHRRLLNEPEGNRNAILFWVAAQAAEEHAEWDVNDLIEEFWDDAMAIGLSPSETKGSIRSGFTKGRRRG